MKPAALQNEHLRMGLVSTLVKIRGKKFFTHSLPLSFKAKELNKTRPKYPSIEKCNDESRSQ
jgi:hypothetical protein